MLRVEKGKGGDKEGREAGSKTRSGTERKRKRELQITFELIFNGSTCCLRELDLARYLFLYGEQCFLNDGFP